MAAGAGTVPITGSRAKQIKRKIGSNMFHLIIEKGAEVGKEVGVPESGIKFGRSPANDLVLDDDVLMLFQGRFFFKSDGTLWITDFSVGEKAHIDGVPVDEQQLKVGDLVEVGSTAFRVISTRKHEEAGAARPEPAREEIDLGFKHSTRKAKADGGSKRHGQSTVVHRLMQVGVSLLVLLVLTAIGSLVLQMDWGGSAQTQQMNTLELNYERVKADTGNIFRYYVHLSEKGVCSIQIDELKSRLHYQKSKPLSPAVLAQLANSLEEVDFYKTESDLVGSAQGQYDLFDLAVKRNSRYHRVRVLNSRLPAAIEQAEEILVDFAARELNIPFTMTMPARERIRYGVQALKLAQTRYAERDVRHVNLAEAIKHYREAMLFLEDIADEREQYELAEAGLEAAARERDERYNDYMFQADHSIALEEWRAAYKNLQILQELVPDREDPRHDKINDKLMSVERHLR